MLYFQPLKIDRHNIIVVCACLWSSKTLLFGPFLVGWFQCSYLNTVLSLLGYVSCFLDLYFDNKSVICWLYNRWSYFKIQFFRFSHFSRSGRMNYFTWRPYFMELHERVTLYVSLQTPFEHIWGSNWIQHFTIFVFKCWNPF
jgi:hypothetical protein